MPLNISNKVNVTNSKIKEYTNKNINKNSMFVDTINSTNISNKNLTFHEIVNGKFKQEKSNYLYQYIKNCLNFNLISNTKNIKKKGTILKFQSIVGYNFNNSFYQNLRVVKANKLNYSVFIKESLQLLNIFFT